MRLSVFFFPVKIKSARENNLWPFFDFFHGQFSFFTPTFWPIFQIFHAHFLFFHGQFFRFFHGEKINFHVHKIAYFSVNWTTFVSAFVVPSLRGIKCCGR